MKIGLTIASLVFCIVLLGLSVAISIGPGYDAWNITIYWIGPLIAIAGCWDIAELITLFGCGKRHGGEFRRGIHPGAHVGVNLIIWLVGIVCIFLSVVAYITARSQIRSCQDEQNSDSSYYSYYYYYCDDDEYSLLSSGLYLPAIQAIEAFVALLTYVLPASNQPFHDNMLTVHAVWITSSSSSWPVSRPTCETSLALLS